MSISHNTSGILFALCAYAMFVVGDSFYKYLGSTYSIYHLAFYSKIAASLVIGFYAVIKRQKIITHFPKLQFYRSLAITITSLSIYYAYRYMTLAEVAIIFYLCPFIIAILSSLILKETVGKHRIISIIIGFTGILIIVRPGFVEFNPGTVAIFLAALSYCYAAILARKMGPSEPSINFALFPSVMTFICVIPLVVLAPEEVPVIHDLSLMALGGTIGATAILLVSMAYVRTHAVTVSILAYTDIIWALLLGYLIFGDVTNDPYTIIGGIIVMISGGYLIYRENKATKNISKNIA